MSVTFNAWDWEGKRKGQKVSGAWGRKARVYSKWKNVKRQRRRRNCCAEKSAPCDSCAFYVVYRVCHTLHNALSNEN